MKKQITILSLIALASCGPSKEQLEAEASKDIHGYIVDKELIKSHYDSVEPRVITAGFSGGHSFSHSSFHSSYHSSGFHSSPHSYYHGSSIHPFYHPIYHPILYGVRPHYHNYKNSIWIGSEFDLYVANKISVHKVSVDSDYFYSVKRGQYVKLKNGKPF